MADLRVVLGIDCETDVGSWTPFYEGLAPGTRTASSCAWSRASAATWTSD